MTTLSPADKARLSPFHRAVADLGIDPRMDRFGDAVPTFAPAAVHSVWFTVNGGTDRETDEHRYIAVWSDGSWADYVTLPERMRGMQTATGIAAALGSMFSRVA